MRKIAAALKHAAFMRVEMQVLTIIISKPAKWVYALLTLLVTFWLAAYTASAAEQTAKPVWLQNGPICRWEHLQFGDEDAKRIKTGFPCDFELYFFDCEIRQNVLRALLSKTKPELLSFENCKITNDEKPSVVEDLPNLKSLTLTGPYIDDSCCLLQNIRGLQGLECLNLDDSRVKGEFLAGLEELRALKELRLRNTLVPDEKLELLGRCHNLEILDIRGTPSSPNCLRAWASLPKLSNLGFSYWKDADNWFSSCDSFIGLKRSIDQNQVCFKNCTLTDRGLLYSRRRCTETAFDFSGTCISDNGLRFFDRVKDAKILSLSNCRITGDGIRISRFPELRQLYLENNPLSQAGLHRVEQIHSLRILSLDSALPPEKDRLEGLAELSKLYTLSIGSNPLFVEDARSIGKLKGLKELEIKHTSVFPSFISELRLSSGIWLLSLEDCRGLDPEVVDELCQFKTLGRLWLHGSDISPGDLKRLRSAIPKCGIRI